MYNKVNRHALAALVAATLAAPVHAAPMSDEAALQLLQRINDMEQELSNLRGENEQLRNDLKELQKNQKEGFLQVDERMEKLKSTSSEADASKSTATTVPPSSTDKGLGDVGKTDMKTDTGKPEDKPEKSDPNGFYSYGTGKQDDKNAGIARTDSKPADDKATDSSKSDSATSGDKPADSKTSDPAKTSDSKQSDQPLPAKEERAVYDEAFKTLLKDPKAAIPAFRSFLKDYPNSSLAASAQYWVGEALYAEKDYKGAADEFLIVLKEHKGSDKAPDAALKLGYSFYEQKEWDSARKTLEDVTKFFPSSDAAKLASQRLEKMKTEGH